MEKSIVEMRRALRGNYYRGVAERFGVSESYVYQIARGVQSARTEGAQAIKRYMMEDLRRDEEMARGVNN